MVWTIEVKRYPIVDPILGIPTGAGHLYLEIFDDDGNRVYQFNAMATDPVTGDIAAVGSDSDILTIVKSTNGVIGDSDSGTRDDYPYDGAVLFSGTQTQVEQGIAYLSAFKDFINSNSSNLHYQLVPGGDHYNSNSGFAGMAVALAQALSIDESALETVEAIRIFGNPGLGQDVLKGATWTPNLDGSTVIGSHVVGTSGIDKMNYGVGSNVLVGLGGDDVFGFGKPPTSGAATVPDGNNTVYGGADTNTVAWDPSDGLDTYIVGAGREISLHDDTGGGSHWEVATPGNSSIKDTLYSIEIQKFQRFDPGNHASFNDLGSDGVTFAQLDDSDLDALNSSQDVTLAAAYNVAYGSASFTIGNLADVTGTTFADEFTIGSGTGLTIDGNGGSDTLAMTASHTAVTGDAVYIDDGSITHAADATVAVNIHDFTTAVDGYFVVGQMGNTFSTPTNYIDTFTTLSYKNYASPITFTMTDSGTAVDGSSNIDTFDSGVSIVGTDHGDTYNLNGAGYILRPANELTDLYWIGR